MSNTTGSRILVVEDDLALKTIMRRVLKQVDPEAQVDWAITAERAMAWLEETELFGDRPYDVVIADIGLPGEQSGLDLWNRCQQKYPDLTFVFSSGMPVDSFLKTIGPSEICPPYLAKPFSPGECRQVLEGVLAYRR